MKEFKNIIIYSIIAIFLMANMNTIHAFNKSEIPKYIEIGLFFRNTAKSSIELKSNSGFQVGIFNNDEFIKIMDLTDKKHIILRKDINGINSSNDQGLYHIEIDKTFNNSEEALNLLKTFSLTDETYLSYDNGWKIFIGRYDNRENAENQMHKISQHIDYDLNIVPPSSKKVQVLDGKGNILLLYNSNENVYFKSNEPISESIINLEGKNYRGAITAKRLSTSDMSIVNKLELEKYLYGVVPRELPALWPLEALKAQAVAARGTAISNINRFRNLGFDLCNTDMSQVYGGYDSEHPNTNRAVDETKGKVLTYKGEIANTFYHSNSGGHTENSENVWSTAVPYIRGVKDDFSLNTTNSTWTVELSKDEIKKLLEKNNIFIGDLLNINVDSRSENGRILQLTVHGTKGSEVLLKERARTVFGLKSTWYNVNDGNQTVDNRNIIIKNKVEMVEIPKLDNKYIISAKGITNITDTSDVKIYNGREYKALDEIVNTNTNTNTNTYVFNGRGWGHGLGMSQYGAKKMAEEGYNYIQILKHYYTGTEVE